MPEMRDITFEELGQTPEFVRTRLAEANATVERLEREITVAVDSARADRHRAELAEARFNELHSWLMHTVGIASSTRSAKKCIEDLRHQEVSPDAS